MNDRLKSISNCISEKYKIQPQGNGAQNPIGHQCPGGQSEAFLQRIHVIRGVGFEFIHFL